MKTNEYRLNGLDCANCAAKIEKNVAGLEGVHTAVVNFTSQTLSVDSKVELSEVIIKKVKSLEPDISIVHKDNEEELSENSIKSFIKLIRVVVGAAMVLSAIFIPMNIYIEYSLFAVAYILGGYDVVLRAFRNLFKGKLLDEHFLMTIATIGAIAIQEYPEAAAVMLFYQLGAFFQDRAVNSSRKSISALMDIKPDSANLETEGELKIVAPEEVSIGDIIVVRPGEKIPLDGQIIQGNTTIDTSAVTGESVPVKAGVDSKAFSGTINLTSLIKIEVKSEFKDSTVSKILDLVSNAANRKSKTEQFITRFARIYTPIVVVSALLLAFAIPFIVPGQIFSEWLYRALVFLVISCPCALVVSVPLSVFGGIGAASREGILIKGGNFLDALTRVKSVVFDKTGTLTEGNFKVTDISCENGISEEDLLRKAVTLESHSNHPVAKAIIEKAPGLSPDAVDSFEDISGMGVKAIVGETTIYGGNIKLMDSLGILVNGDITASGTVVYIAVDNKYYGSIVVQDKIKNGSKAAIHDLKELGIKENIMLTGDLDSVASAVSNKLNLDTYYAELLPHQKVEKMEDIMEVMDENENLLFAGDGINDAPVITRADIGVAMGGLGSDAAIEAADIVIMDDNPHKIASAIKISQRTKTIVMQNIWFSIAIKVGFLGLATVGISTMWMALFADVGVTILAVLNSLRVLKKNRS